MNAMDALIKREKRDNAFDISSKVRILDKEHTYNKALLETERIGFRLLTLTEFIRGLHPRFELYDKLVARENEDLSFWVVADIKLRLGRFAKINYGRGTIVGVSEELWEKTLPELRALYYEGPLPLTIDIPNDGNERFTVVGGDAAYGSKSCVICVPLEHEKIPDKTLLRRNEQQ